MATYSPLRFLQSDELQTREKQRYARDGWIITNKLPIELILYTEKYLSGTPTKLCVLSPYERRVFPPTAFADRDQLFTYVIGKNGELVPLLMSYMFREQWKKIELGAIEYSSDGGHGEVQASNWDMRGVWLHNRMRIPLSIYFEGRLVAQMNAYDGMTYLGGSGSSVYYDYDREGIDIDTRLEVRFSTATHTYVFDIIVGDNQALSVFIGTITGGAIGPDPDNFIYKVDSPNVTGTTFYRPIGGYRSEMTNPSAPF